MLDPLHLLRVLRSAVRAITAASVLGIVVPSTADELLPPPPPPQLVDSSLPNQLAQFPDPARQHQAPRVDPEALYAPIDYSAWREAPAPVEPTPLPGARYTTGGMIGAAIGMLLPDVAIIGGATLYAGPVAGVIAAGVVAAARGASRYQKITRKSGDTYDASLRAAIHAAAMAALYAVLFGLVMLIRRLYRKAGGLQRLRVSLDRGLSASSQLSTRAVRVALYGTVLLAGAYVLLFLAWSTKVMLAQLLD